MSYDGNMLRHVTNEIKPVLLTSRVSKIYQLSKYELLFNLHTKKGKKQLLISASFRYSRLHLTKMQYEKPNSPPNFGMFLRKQLEGGVINDMVQHVNDRVIDLVIEKRDELGDLKQLHLICELMGRHSNIIVTDENFVILEAIKHSMPFDGNQRTIYPSAKYTYPTTQKMDPFDETKRKEFLSNPDNYNKNALLRNFMGFSPLVCKEIIHRFNHSKKAFKDVFIETITEESPVIIEGEKELFYFTDITHYDGTTKSFNTVCDMLDSYFFERDKQEKIKQRSKFLQKFVKNNLKKAKNKLELLTKDYFKTKEMEQYQLKGELIQANLHNISAKDRSLTCTNYYNNEEVTISLDPDLTPVENAQKYFKKYKKMKKSVPYIKRQITDARRKIKYFDELETQIENASLKDIDEIRDELIDKKLLKRKKQPKKRRKKRPNYSIYTVEGTEFIVGKNNIQNEYITHKLANYNDVWFHVKDAPGSHVVVRDSLPLSEQQIRTAAQLASYYSKMKRSSSVAVDYTEVRNLKKIPGKMGSYVSYKKQKTIFIDPDESYILSLNEK
ncbi:MAG: NFACT family protein [Candidatus Izimaplasma sp.]|nr:NFACT family protein [Candidatus Izimaplasma bacterium]